MNEREKKGFGANVRHAFVTGLLLCLPVTVTVYIILWLLNTMAYPARGILTYVLGVLDLNLGETLFFNASVTIVSALLVAIFITVVGFVSGNLFGKWFIKVLDNILERLPMVRSVYSSIKQIIDTFSTSKKDTFRQAVLVEFPRKNCWTIGFVTSTIPTKFGELTGTQKLAHVFVPTTPNPTGGYMIFVPVEELKFLSISVAESMKIIVSGGAVVPDSMKISEQKIDAVSE